MSGGQRELPLPRPDPMRTDSTVSGQHTVLAACEISDAERQIASAKRPATAWIWAPVGAILMNCAISGYAQTKLGGTGGELSEVTRGDPKITTPIRELIHEILSGCDVTRRVRSTTNDGADFQPLTRTFRFRHGPIEYVGLLRPDRRPGAIQPSDYVPVTIDFGQRSHLYDVRQGKYLGHQVKVATKIASGVAQLYALLPYQIQRLTVAVRCALSR